MSSFRLGMTGFRSGDVLRALARTVQGFLGSSRSAVVWFLVLIPRRTTSPDGRSRHSVCSTVSVKLLSGFLLARPLLVSFPRFALLALRIPQPSSRVRYRFLHWYSIHQRRLYAVAARPPCSAGRHGDARGTTAFTAVSYRFTAGGPF